MLPLVALVLSGMLQVVVVARDVLVTQEAARAGARAVVATGRAAAAVAAARQAAGRRDVRVVVRPAVPRPGDVLTVRVTAVGRLGPLRPVITGEAVAVQEPGILPESTGAGRESGPPARAAPSETSASWTPDAATAPPGRSGP